VSVVSALLVGGGRIAEVANMSACNRNVSFAILPSDFFRLNRLTENVRVRIFGVNVVGSNAALPRLTCLLVGDSSCSADALRFELAAAILGEGKSGVAPNVGSGVEWNEDSEAFEGVVERAMARIPLPMTESTLDRLPDLRRERFFDFRLLGPPISGSSKTDWRC